MRTVGPGLLTPGVFFSGEPVLSPRRDAQPCVDLMSRFNTFVGRQRAKGIPLLQLLKHEMSGVEMYWLGRLCLMMLWSLWNNISKTESKYTFNILQILWCINFTSTNFIPYELYIHLPFQRQGVEFGRSSNLALRHRASTLRFVGRSSAIRRHITWASRWVGLVFGSP